MKKIEDYFIQHLSGNNPLWALIRNRDYETEFSETELRKLSLDELKTLRHHTFFYVKEGLRSLLSYLYKSNFCSSSDNNGEFVINFYAESYIVEYHGKQVYSEAGVGFATLGSWITKIENYAALAKQREERKNEIDANNERDALIKLLTEGETLS